VEAVSLYRARRLEQALQTPARIYYKHEGRAPPQPQAEHLRGAGLLQQGGGIKRIATETGAGQWGSALAFAVSCSGSRSSLHGRVSYDRSHIAAT